ncbi:putative BET1-like protein [Helianthus annuus]|nr:putative BET1-like protein [Helianthus annuus]
MSYRRDNRASRTALFDNLDGIEEGGLRASSSYSRDIDEQENEKSLNSLQDRIVFLKRLTGDIREEVQTHNRMLDRMGNGMDSARGIMSGTMDKLKTVFETKSSRRTCKLVIYLVLAFFILYYLFRFLLPAAV